VHIYPWLSCQKLPSAELQSAVSHPNSDAKYSIQFLPPASPYPSPGHIEGKTKLIGMQHGENVQHSPTMSKYNIPIAAMTKPEKPVALILLQKVVKQRHEFPHN
jgi:hypothetical protein